MILPFTLIELTALGIALLIYARHALDYESIAIDGSVVTVEKNIGGKLERHEFNSNKAIRSCPLGSLFRLMLGPSSIRICVSKFVSSLRAQGKLGF